MFQVSGFASLNRNAFGAMEPPRGAFLLYNSTMDPKSIADRQLKEQKAAAEKLAAQRHDESLAKIDALATSNLQIMRSFVVYLNKRTSKTELTNQLDSIATPDALALIPIIEALDKTVKDKQIDWAPIQEALKPITEALKQQAAKKDPEAIKIPEVDYKQIADGFSKAITSLAAPVVNVTAPVIKVLKADAPIINTEKVDLKPFVNEVLQVLTDFRVWTQDQLPEATDLSGVEGKLDKSNELLKKIEKKNFGGGGGGGGGGYIFKAGDVAARPLVAPDTLLSILDPTMRGIVVVNADGSTVGGGGGGAVTNDGTFATPARQDIGNTSLSTIAAKDFATQTTLALIKAKTDNLDVALSTRTKPADAQLVNNPTSSNFKAQIHGLAANGSAASAQNPVLVAGSDGTSQRNLKTLTDGTVVVDGSAVTQPVSAASLPLPPGAATSANQLPNNHNVVVTSAPTTAVTGPLTDTQLRATPVPVSVTGGGDASAANQTTEITRLTSIRDQQTDGSQIVGIDNTKSVKYYAQVLTATTTLTPTSGKKIKLVKMQVLQNPDNSSANQVTLGFVSTGNFFIGWVGSDNAEVTGATNEALDITLANAQPVSVLIRYKEL